MSVTVRGLPDEKFTLSWCGGDPRRRRRLSVSDNPAIIHLLAPWSHICKNVIGATTLHGVSPRWDPSGPFTPLLDVFFQKKKKVRVCWWRSNKGRRRKPAVVLALRESPKKIKIKTIFSACFQPSYLNSSVRFQAFAEIPRQSNGNAERVKTNNRMKDLECLPAEKDAPAYIKAQAATLRRVNGGRHLGDSSAERVSLWKWCHRRRRRVCWECQGGEVAVKKREDKMPLERFFSFYVLCWRKRLMGRLSPVHCTHGQNKAPMALGTGLGWMEQGRLPSVRPCVRYLSLSLSICMSAGVNPTLLSL